MVGKLRAKIAGKKTYLLCIAAIITSAVAWAEGHISTVDFVQAVFAAMGGMTLRAGISKVKNNGIQS